MSGVGERRSSQVPMHSPEASYIDRMVDVRARFLQWTIGALALAGLALASACGPAGAADATDRAVADLVAAESIVWTTGDVTEARRRPVANSAGSPAIAPDAVNEILERSAMLRGTITDAGFDVAEFSEQETHRFVRREGRRTLEVRVTRSWVEVDRSSGERTEVGGSDIYRFPMATQSSSLVTPPVDIASEGESSSDDGVSRLAVAGYVIAIVGVGVLAREVPPRRLHGQPTVSALARVLASNASVMKVSICSHMSTNTGWSTNMKSLCRPSTR